MLQRNLFVWNMSPSFWSCLSPPSWCGNIEWRKHSCPSILKIIEVLVLSWASHSNRCSDTFIQPLRNFGSLLSQKCWWITVRHGAHSVEGWEMARFNPPLDGLLSCLSCLMMMNVIRHAFVSSLSVRICRIFWGRTLSAVVRIYKFIWLISWSIFHISQYVRLSHVIESYHISSDTDSIWQL